MTLAKLGMAKRAVDAWFKQSHTCRITAPLNAAVHNFSPKMVLLRDQGETHTANSMDFDTVEVR